MSFFNKLTESFSKMRKTANGGGNCSSSSGTTSKRSKCPPPTIMDPPPSKASSKSLKYNDEEISNILFKIVKAKKEGLTAEQALNFDEMKSYENYLLQKKEKNLKLKAKEEEAARIREAAKVEETKRKEAAKLEETKRKEEISRKRLEAEERKRKLEEEKKQKQEEDARKKLEAETKKKEEAANAQIASYKKANPSRADLLVKNFGKSSSKISKRSKGSKGGKKQSTRRNK
jgi:hypothetical protein